MRLTFLIAFFSLFINTNSSASFAETSSPAEVATVQYDRGKKKSRKHKRINKKRKKKCHKFARKGFAG